MDSSVIIGIVSLIGAIHFSFAISLIERVESSNKPRDKGIPAFRILIFVPLSDGMVGLMFSALVIHLSLTIVKNWILWVILSVLISFSVFVLVATWKRINKIIDYCKEEYNQGFSPWLARIFLILFFLFLYVLAGRILCAQSSHLSESLQQLAVMLSTISFIGWMVCIAMWRPITSLGEFLE